MAIRKDCVYPQTLIAQAFLSISIWLCPNLSCVLVVLRKIFDFSEADEKLGSLETIRLWESCTGA